jgi:epoxyqueuosine reductase
MHSVNSQANMPIQLTPREQHDKATALAREHGFTLSGIAQIPEDGRAPRAEAYERWLENGFHGPLHYMLQSRQTRVRLNERVPWARSVLLLGAFYAAGARGEPGRDLAAHVARYARGRDYHNVLDKRVKKLALALRKCGVCSCTHTYTDTGPVLERAWAEAAGLGWIGKNGCLIHPRLGSFFFLSEIIMDSLPEPDAPAPPHCGTCRRCLDACPTQALVAPGVLDANRCIVTWNIEQRGQSEPATWSEQREWVAGCDICQTVCPYNAPRRVGTPDPEFATPLPWEKLTLADCITLDAATFDRAFPASALRRSGIKGMRLGAITVAGNLKAEPCRAALQACLADPDADVRQRAAWALEQFVVRAARPKDGSDRTERA